MLSGRRPRMAATVSLAEPAARAGTARSRRAARTSSLSERVSGKGMAIAAPLRKGPGSIHQDTTTPQHDPRQSVALLCCRGNNHGEHGEHGEKKEQVFQK